jgi:hypothetical protein
MPSCHGCLKEEVHVSHTQAYTSTRAPVCSDIHGCKQEARCGELSMSVEALECTLQSLESSSSYSKLDTAAEKAKTLSSDNDVLLSVLCVPYVFLSLIQACARACMDCLVLVTLPARARTRTSIAPHGSSTVGNRSKQMQVWSQQPCSRRLRPSADCRHANKLPRGSRRGGGGCPQLAAAASTYIPLVSISAAAERKRPTHGL